MAGAGVAGATALASWALLEARRRRSRRLRQSRVGSRFPPPDPTLGRATVAVKASADLPAVDRLDAALHHLAACWVPPRDNQGWHANLRRLRHVKDHHRVVAPRPQVILRHPNNDIELFLAEPVEDAAGPWQPRAGGAIWALPHDAPLPDDLSRPMPCPALVQLGTCEDGAELYADLEALGTLGLDGPPEAVRQIARALTATVVVSPAAQLCRVLTYGFDPYGLDEQARPRLIASATLDALLDEAEATARPVAAAVAEEQAGSSFRLRSVVPEEGWEPAIAIVAGSPLSPEQERRLAAVGGREGQGAAVVKAGAAPRWALEAAEPVGWWRLNPLGMLVRPVGLAGEELRELAAFLAEADAEPVPVDVASRPTTTSAGSAPRPPAPRPSAPGYQERDWLVMICLLGPIDIVNRDGVSEQGDRGQPLELLAWLATHRSVSTRAGAMEALWSGRVIDPRTLRNVISAARLLLRNLAGEPPDGAQWIPLRQERLKLHPLVVTDIDLLRDRMAYAKRVGPEEAATVLAEGLQMLRGVPFEGQQWLWADEDYLASSIAAEAVTMATELTTLRLQAGDIRGALAATDVGLHVIPLHDQLTELSIQAWIASGERRTALSVYEAYERATAARGEAVAPEIARLRNELLRAVMPE
ncbi:MAG: bacterial transcriptional activator domain-containing protein [Actinomycetota bacterium]|nr:bacterial transcriptional activator domain-containing protein [Actinomycetota bacterium]